MNVENVRSLLRFIFTLYLAVFKLKEICNCTLLLLGRKLYDVTMFNVNNTLVNDQAREHFCLSLVDRFLSAVMMT